MPKNTEPVRFQCRHIFTDGRRCGSPSLRGPDGPEHFCYYHHKTRRPGPRQPQVKSLADRKSSTFDLPSPADLSERSGIQHAIGLILHKIAHNELDPRRAGLLLYGLQIASMNLPREKAAPQRVDPEELVDELVHDPEVGALAPEADWEDNRPKSTVERLLEEFGCNEDEEESWQPTSTPKPNPYPVSLNAAAATQVSPAQKSGPKFHLSRTFARKYGSPTPAHARSTPRPQLRIQAPPSRPAAPSPYNFRVIL